MLGCGCKVEKKDRIRGCAEEKERNVGMLGCSCRIEIIDIRGERETA